MCNAQAKNSLENHDLGHVHADLMFPEDCNDRHRKKRHLQGMEDTDLSQIVVQAQHCGFVIVPGFMENRGASLQA